MKYALGVAGINAIQDVYECLSDECVVAVIYPMVPDGLVKVTLIEPGDEEQVQIIVDDALQRQDVGGATCYQLVVEHFRGSGE